ncbi:unnamed protein product [Linum tenue]|uniref:Uncharacterized protein n=1 Tax=Linum tenue TaxID=586396 RepID=A0AAV0JNF6_9ROSI|nr:unnamed protein product [Linum tenue]
MGALIHATKDGDWNRMAVVSKLRQLMTEIEDEFEEEEEDMAFFDSEKVGGLTSRLRAECQQLSNVIGNNIHLIVRSTFQVPGGSCQANSRSRCLCRYSLRPERLASLSLRERVAYGFWNMSFSTLFRSTQLQGKSQIVQDGLVRLGEQMVSSFEGTKALALELCREFEDKFLQHVTTDEVCI